MNETFSLGQFLKRFKDDDACLEEIKLLRWPSGITCAKCQKVTKYYKLDGRKAYSCEFCRTQVFPLKSTIFEKTSTPLRLWFYAMFIMVQTRSGVSAKQLQCELGVTYKTAWRMFHQVRLLMEQGGGDMLKGEVEIDETFVGGKAKNRKAKWNNNEIPKGVVMGMVERNGRVYIKHVPNSGKWTLLNQIRASVDPTAKVFTDEYVGYKNLMQYGYDHQTVIHNTGNYVSGSIHTQNIENMWSHLKRGIYGVYRVVSKKYLQKYADEYAWRYNNRKSKTMFDDLLRQIVTIRPLGSVRPA